MVVWQVMIPAKPYKPILILSITLFVLGACVPPTPVLVFVTPTPQATSTASPTVVSQALPTASPQAVPTAIDTATEPPPTTPSPTVTFIGPVVGPDYTLPPTSTPRPTDTPTPSDTPTLGPTPTPSLSPTPRGPTPTVLPYLDPSQMGVQVHTLVDQAAWDDILRRLDQLQVGWVKVQVNWALLQPNGPNEAGEEFRRLELYLESLDQRGFNVLVSVAKAPDWARSVTVEDGPPDDPMALANFLTFMLNEFGNVIDAIEVWNEPNLIREWRGIHPLSGGGYMRLFRPAYNAIRTYSPDIVVVTAALAPTGNNDGISVDDRLYLQQMYDAGLASFTDVAIGAHPFSWGNPPDARCCDPIPGRNWDDDPHFFFANTLDDYRAIMTRNGHANRPIWVTEFGWATWDGYPGQPPEPWMAYNDKWAQANYTLRAFQIGQERDDIGPMILWNLNFGILPEMIDNRDERAAYSLLVPSHPAERPLYWMIYDAVRPDVVLDRYD